TYFDFKIKRDISTPLVGITLLCIAILDMLHLLIAEGAIVLKLPFSDAVYISWLYGRVLNASFLIIGTGTLLIIRPKWIRRVEQKIKFLKIIGSVFILITLLTSISLYALDAVPDFVKKETGFIRQPSEFFTVILFFIWGALIMPKVLKTSPTIFSRLLILSIIPAIFAAIHMSVSLTLFDADYNIAQFLKLFTFIIPLAGISLNYSKNI